jgi:hypothetical protein
MTMGCGVDAHPDGGRSYRARSASVRQSGSLERYREFSNGVDSAPRPARLRDRCTGPSGAHRCRILGRLAEATSASKQRMSVSKLPRAVGLHDD